MACLPARKTGTKEAEGPGESKEKWGLWAPWELSHLHLRRMSNSSGFIQRQDLTCLLGDYFMEKGLANLGAGVPFNSHFQESTLKGLEGSW